MLFKTVLFCCFSVFACFGQKYMPEPLTQEVKYVGARLPSLEVEIGVRGVDNNKVTLREPTNRFITGSDSVIRSHMIILQYIEQEPTIASIEPESLKVFYLQDNIWNESKRILEKYYKLPPNLYILRVASEIASHNEVKVPVWKLDGIILDVKMPKGYKLKYPVGLP